MKNDINIKYHRTDKSRRERKSGGEWKEKKGKEQGKKGENALKKGHRLGAYGKI